MILKHVAQTDTDLSARSAASRLQAVSTFTSIGEAEQAITTTFRLNRDAIVRWARTAGPNDRQAFSSAIPGGVGRILSRGATAPLAGTAVRIVLKKEAYNGKLYYVLTAYPQ